MKMGLTMSVQEFLDSLPSKGTKKVYKSGLKKFFKWYRKTPDQVLKERKDDLTQRPDEDLVTYKNRAANYSKIIERFHAHLLEEGYRINTAKSLTNGIRQLFRYYQMDIKVRNGSSLNRTVKTQRNFPLTIEHVRKMYAVANFRERVILSMATDLGLRVSDFLKIKKQDLPDLSLEAPISFDVMTEKEDVIARGFLSQETVELLKKYLKTLPKDNPYLFPSSQNKPKPISRTQIGNLLKDLAQKAELKVSNGKSLTFHCFRKMLLSAAIDSGIGLTAGKKLVGKTIPQSDDTYLTTVKLRDKFIQLKKFQTIELPVRSEDQQLEKLSSLVAKLSEELEQQKMVTQAVTAENMMIRSEFKKRVAELNEEIGVSRLLGEQIAKIGESVKKWQEEKGEIEAKIAGIENFHKLVLEQPDEEVLEFIKDIRRQLIEQRRGESP
ncbi:MAG: tyrosine-type recombinase/integrase [Candidatus Bathyarchaeum sp.]|nr:MAG: tyrosine-type recombinase/integrase [Candidatus Bathyarchaeum sp.]